MRTIKFLKSEVAASLQKYEEHQNNCSDCQHQPKKAEDEIICLRAEDLYNDYEILLGELKHAERIFKQNQLEKSNIF